MATTPRRRALCFLGGLTLLSSLAYAFWEFFGRGGPGWLDFRKRQQEYTRIVEEAKARTDAAAVIRGIQAYWVRREGGHFIITLVTEDRGHFGKAGYVYSDSELVHVTGDPYTDVDAPGDLWMLGAQVAPHWWVVTNRLQ